MPRRKKDAELSATQPDDDSLVSVGGHDDFEASIGMAIDGLKKELISLINKRFKELSDQLIVDRKAVTDLRSELVSVRQELDNIKAVQSTLPTPTSVGATAPADPITFSTVVKSAPVSCEIRSIIRDADRRCKNIIISGLEPVPGQEDAITVEYLFEANLPIKIPVGSAKCVRIGKPAQGKPRKLLVSLQSVARVTDILRVARDLRKSTDPAVSSSVFINRDLCPTDSKAEYEKRLLRRAQPSASTSSTTGVSGPANSGLRANAPAFNALTTGGLGSAGLISTSSTTLPSSSVGPAHASG